MILSTSVYPPFLRKKTWNAPLGSLFRLGMTAVTFILVAASCCSTLRAQTPSATATECRRKALELAGAFSNDGFRLRDGQWAGVLEGSSRARVLEVGLYSGNSYWFSAAVSDPSTEVTLSVYTESGQLLAHEIQREGGRCAVNVSPETSGPFYIKIELPSHKSPTSTPTTFSLVYSYK